MTQKHFFEVLAMIKRGWVLEGRDIRRKTAARRFCPITAVCLKEKRLYYDMYRWKQAANQLSLASVFAY